MIEVTINDAVFIVLSCFAAQWLLLIGFLIIDWKTGG